MSTPPSIVELEDLVGAQLSMTALGIAARPIVVGRYEIVEMRGRGARGLVVRAQDLKLGRRVALKLYPPLQDERLETEVIREAQALARLEAPNVVRVYDVGRGQLIADDVGVDCLYLAMEYVEGRNLRAWATEQPRKRVLDAFLGAGRGLAAAHAAGLIHRDFKPENVMITSEGVAKVVDFGLARGVAVGASPEASGALHDRITRLGSVVGTPEYMAPEARYGFADARSDQFSFAMALWELLAGCLPFNAQQTSARPPSATLFRGAPQVAPSVRNVLERALASVPEGRFANMPALVEAVRRADQRIFRTPLIAAAGLVGVLVIVGVTWQAFGMLAADDAVSPDTDGAGEDGADESSEGAEPSDQEEPTRTWWCLCYERRESGRQFPATACRVSRLQCGQLIDAFAKTKSRGFVQGSIEPGCTRVSGEWPWETLGHSQSWRPSRKEGNWWAPYRCLLSKKK